MLPSPHGHPVDQHAEASASGPPPPPPPSLPAPSDRHILSSTSSSVPGLNTTTAGPPGPGPVPGPASLPVPVPVPAPQAPPPPPPLATVPINTTAATAVIPGAMLPEGLVHHPQPYYSSPHEHSFPPHHHHLPQQPLLHHHQAPLPLTAVPLRRRRSSKLAMPASIRRTASTPNVRATASPVDPSIMPFGSNGKGVRNKLGYHRTSVACGHCRRRKIRCLLAADDPQGRCSNCIRLKKECNFFPVDQQPPLNRPSQSSHKTERTSSNGSSSASESPPSTQGLGRAPGMGSHSVPYHSYPSASQAPGPPGFPGPLDRQRTDSASSKGRGVVPIASTPHGSRPQLPHLPPGPGLSAGYDPTRPERPTGWEGSPYLDQSPMSANGGKPVLEDPATSFWRLAESPMGPSVPSFQGPPPPPPHQLPMIHHRESVGVFPYHVQREEMSWPSRSMSYGQLEGLGANHSGGQYPPPQTPDFKHPPPSTLYPPPYAGTGQYPVTSTPEPSSAPADGRGPNGAFAMHPPWHPSYTGNTIGPMAGKEAEGYNGWFQGSNRLSQVDEEVHTGPLNEDPSTMYQGTNQSSG